MVDFLKVLVAFLAANAVLPPEVTATDTDREKTYLQTLPDEPPKVFCARIYDGELPTLVDKQAGIYRIQVTVRNPKQAEALADITKLWRFLISRPEPIEDISPTTWAIFDVQSVPVPLGRDEKGNYLYSLSFPVKTSMY